MNFKDDITRQVLDDASKSKEELLYELRLQRLENLRLQERLAIDHHDFSQQRQHRYLENIALIDKAILHTKDLDEMMDALMDAIRAIFGCDQAWLMTPCDPESPTWQVPFRSTSSQYPIPFSTDVDIPATPDLQENCRLALISKEPIPLGPASVVKDIPEEARKATAKSALLIALYPKKGSPWLMGLHQCSTERTWTPEEKQMYRDIAGRIADALSATLLYRDLLQNQDRLKHLSTQLFQAQERERKRVAEEIHDELAQPILAIKMGVENALFLIGEDAPETMERSLQSASNLSKALVNKMRRMQTSLYPPTLRDFGAITALNGFLTDFRNIYTTITVRKAVHLLEEDIPEHLRVVIFRLAQEALYNAAKHSQAGNVTVTIDLIGCLLFLEVSDDGVGFDPTKIIRYPAKRLGLGLTSMQERTETSGGKMTITSEPGKGTAIKIVWTLPVDKDGNEC